MGKGDKKTKRGKIIMGSFGVRRRRRALKKTVKAQEQQAPVQEAEVAKAPAKKRAKKEK
jgi:30S ribosomal protein S31